jgi:hypothetical protein
MIVGKYVLIIKHNQYYFFFADCFKRHIDNRWAFFTSCCLYVCISQINFFIHSKMGADTVFYFQCVVSG